jgi:flagellar biosynthesis protein FlhG
LQSLRSDFDIFVIDLGSGLNSWTRRFWLQANLVLLVTTTDSSALMDAYAMIKLSVADEFGPDIRLVVNHYEDDGIAEGAYRRLSNACGRFLARTLPAVPSLPRYVDDGGANPLPRVWETTDTPFGHAMLWLGRAVGDVLSEKSSTPIVMSAA